MVMRQRSQFHAQASQYLAYFIVKFSRDGLSLFLLHAHQLSFIWPESGVEFTASAPLPAELAAVIDQLQVRAPR